MSDLSVIGINLSLAGIVVLGFVLSWLAGLFGFYVNAIMRMMGFIEDAAGK